jgi:hypothetical protein
MSAISKLIEWGLLGIPILGLATKAMNQESAQHGFLHGQGQFQAVGMTLIVINLALWFWLGNFGYWVCVIIDWLLFIAVLKNN